MFICMRNGSPRDIIASSAVSIQFEDTEIEHFEYQGFTVMESFYV